MGFDKQSLCDLYTKVSGEMSPRRFAHTAAVAEMAVRMGKIYASDKLEILRAAGLLHDIT